MDVTPNWLIKLIYLLNVFEPKYTKAVIFSVLAFRWFDIMDPSYMLTFILLSNSDSFQDVKIINKSPNDLWLLTLR